MPMKNALEVFRIERGMTFRELASACSSRGLNAVYRHCKADKIPAEAAAEYSEAFGIPRSELRPDLWPPATATPATQRGGEDAA